MRLWELFSDVQKNTQTVVPAEKSSLIQQSKGQITVEAASDLLQRGRAKFKA
jgi:hypothetical protein